jgi:hypothetical protein
MNTKTKIKKPTPAQARIIEARALKSKPQAWQYVVDYNGGQSSMIGGDPEESKARKDAARYVAYYQERYTDVVCTLDHYCTVCESDGKVYFPTNNKWVRKSCDCPLCGGKHILSSEQILAAN